MLLQKRCDDGRGSHSQLSHLCKTEGGLWLHPEPQKQVENCDSYLSRSRRIFEANHFAFNSQIRATVPKKSCIRLRKLYGLGLRNGLHIPAPVRGLGRSNLLGVRISNSLLHPAEGSLQGLVISVNRSYSALHPF